MSTDEPRTRLRQHEIRARERHSGPAHEPHAVSVVAGARPDQSLRRRERLVRRGDEHRCRAAAPRHRLHCRRHGRGLRRGHRACGRRVRAPGRARQDDHVAVRRDPGLGVSRDHHDRRVHARLGSRRTRPVSRPISTPTWPRSCSRVRACSSSPRSGATTASDRSAPNSRPPPNATNADALAAFLGRKA